MSSARPASHDSHDEPAAVPRPAPVRRAHWRVDVSDAVALPGAQEIAVDVVVPDPAAGAVRGVLVCLPGGFLSRTYFDLEVDGDRRFSFAEAMAARGWATLALDHLGTGKSSRPAAGDDGGDVLGVEAIARANQRALDRALARLAGGDPETDVPPVPSPITVGVGHSMGSGLTVEQQALARPHRALVLFSFTTAGLPDLLDPSLRPLANDPARARAEIGALVRCSLGSAHPEAPTGPGSDREAAFGIGTAPALARTALGRASTRLLGVGGLLSMIPGGFAPPAAAIDVPVLVALGDHDLHDARGLEAMFPRAPEVATFVLEDCWHCHFVANTRQRLFDAVADWLDEHLAQPLPPDRSSLHGGPHARQEGDRR